MLGPSEHPAVLDTGNTLNHNRLTLSTGLKKINYQKRLNKVLSFVVMSTSEDFLHLTTMSACV